MLPLLLLESPYVGRAVLRARDELEPAVGPLYAVDRVRVGLDLEDAPRALLAQHHVDAHVVVGRAGGHERAARAEGRADHLRLARAHFLVVLDRLWPAQVATVRDDFCFRVCCIQ